LLEFTQDTANASLVEQKEPVIISSKNYKVIPLTKGFVAIIDAKDYRRVNKYSWRVHISRGSKRKAGQPYARGVVNGKDTYLHRFIKEKELAHVLVEGCTDNERFWQVDHKNHQTLDCRNENLEVVSYIVNQSRRRKRK